MARRLAILAGEGSLAPQTIAAARDAGWDVQVFDMVGRDDLGELSGRLTLDDPEAALRTLKQSGVTHLCPAGAIEVTDVQRRALINALGRFGGGRGDTILSRFGGYLVARFSLKLIGVDRIMPEAVAPEGHFGGPAGRLPDVRLARHALNAARAIGAIDMGQAVIALNGRIVAAEGYERTQGLIERCGPWLRAHAPKGGALLAKAVKPRQPRFMDLPAIGPDTVKACAEASISAIVVEAGASLLIERERLLADADRLGVALLGLKHRG